MKKLLLLLLLPVMLLGGCGDIKSDDFVSVEQDRFVEVKNYWSTTGCDYTIVVDKETRVMYLMFRAGYKGGLTVMLNPDGTPMLWEGEL